LASAHTQKVNEFCIAAQKYTRVERKISLAKFSFRTNLTRWAKSVRFSKERAKMAWKTPKIVEVSVGMEINMYACAARK
jgi:coenzyme PQQ precursor peptide PqqA